MATLSVGRRARQVARDRGKVRVLWSLPPGDAWVGAELENQGLRNEDAPGFEAVVDALALEEPPAGEVPDDVQVAVVETWEQYRDSFAVNVASFGVPDPPESAVRERFERYGRTAPFFKMVCASIDGRVVGTGSVGFSPVGLNLLAGCILPEARGRGVYRAMVHKRWQIAVDHGTPALVIQAGRMSRPICERMGFRFVDSIRTYVDELG